MNLILCVDGTSLIILALVTSNIRNCSLPTVKMHALDVMLSLASYLTDEAKLDRMVPYAVELLHDSSTMVRSAAVRTLVQIVSVTDNLFA
jgi:phosphoinositide-3-kinase, regulatory subunit 4